MWLICQMCSKEHNKLEEIKIIMLELLLNDV